MSLLLELFLLERLPTKDPPPAESAEDFRVIRGWLESAPSLPLVLLVVDGVRPICSALLILHFLDGVLRDAAVESTGDEPSLDDTSVTADSGGSSPTENDIDLTGLCTCCISKGCLNVSLTADPGCE